MRKTLLNYLLWTILAVVVIAGSLATYMWFMPHRNVRSTRAFAEMEAKALVLEFTADAAKANAKYLASDGNSKVLILEGRVESITSNQRNEKVVLLKDEGARAGVSCTFTEDGNGALNDVKKGDIIKVKGAITAGNRHDPDLDLTEHAVLVQCTLIK